MSLTRERQIVAAVWNQKGLWLIHLVANAVLLGLLYQWLGIPDRTVTHLMISALSGLAILTLLIWLHGGTLAHFRDAHGGGDTSWIATFKTSLGKLAAFAFWAAILGLAIWWTLRLGRYQVSASNWLSSFLTLRLQRPVTPATVATVFSWTIALTGLIILPLLLLPWGSNAARDGFRGFAPRHLKTFTKIRYWIAYIALFVMGALIPYWLVWWVPEISGFYLETASWVIRFTLAYVLATTSWLLLASVVGSWTIEKGESREAARSEAG